MAQALGSLHGHRAANETQFPSVSRNHTRVEEPNNRQTVEVWSGFTGRSPLSKEVSLSCPNSD